MTQFYQSIVMGMFAVFLAVGCAEKNLELSSTQSQQASIEALSNDLEVNGELTEMDETGNLNGNITISHQAIGNMSKVKLKFFSFKDGEKDYIGSYQIPVRDLLGNQGTCHQACSCSCNENSITFPFIFLVPPEYRCHTILVFIEDPVSGQLIQIPARVGYLNKARSEHGNYCEDEPEPTPPPQPTPAPTPDIEIDHVYSAGRIVEVAGTCEPNAGDIEFMGNLSNKTSLNTECNNGSFLHCAIGKKPFQENNIKAVITDSYNQSAEDSAKYLMNHPPIVEFTMDTIQVNGHKAAVSGKCTNGAKITLNIYNEDVAVLDCEEGSYHYSHIKLVNVQNRILFGTQVTSFGVTSKIWFDVDGDNTQIDCSIDDVKSNELVCKSFAGTVSGSCHAGLPVRVMVDGKLQEIAYCNSDGEFTATNILLNELGMDNDLTIKQITPFGKTCQDTITMQEFPSQD